MLDSELVNFITFYSCWKIFSIFWPYLSTASRKIWSYFYTKTKLAQHIRNTHIPIFRRFECSRANWDKIRKWGDQNLKTSKITMHKKKLWIFVVGKWVKNCFIKMLVRKRLFCARRILMSDDYNEDIIRLFVLSNLSKIEEWSFEIWPFYGKSIVIKIKTPIIDFRSCFQLKI